MASGFALDVDPVVDFWAAQRDANTAAAELWRIAAVHFKRLELEAALRLYEQLYDEQPQCRCYLWARGIALFYKPDYKAAAAQFQQDQQVNANDAEEILWMHLCQRAAGGSKSLGKCCSDPGRPVIAMVSQAFCGTITPEAVLAAHAASPRDEFYGLLYMALHAEQCEEQAQLAKDRMLAANNVLHR